MLRCRFTHAPQAEPWPDDMTEISTHDADGREPLAICQRNREWLVGYYKVPEMIVLRYLTHDMPVDDAQQSTESKAVKHLQECPRCRAWANSIVPKSTFERQSRLVRYCCSGMFCAVEEPGQRGSPHITFSMFRGEDPCWQVDGKNAFLRYCPWCGKKLPDKPFIEE